VTQREPDEPHRSPSHVRPDERLAGLLMERLRTVDFGGVVDLGRREPGLPAPTVARSPHVDVAVIALDAAGQAVAAANVQQSSDVPRGRIVPLGADLAALDTDFRAWDLARWEDLAPEDFAATPYPDGSALVTGAGGVPFMSPYPASVFKLLVAVQVLRLVDAGRLELAERTVNRAPEADGIEGRSLPPQGAEPTVEQALDAMITYSDNVSTCLLLQQLHALGELDPERNALNDTFARLGMPTLQVNGTDPVTGTRWGVGDIHMTAMDTARLLLLLQGGRLSHQEGGSVRPSNVLRPGSRGLLLSLLADQGLHEVLSTTNWCGRPYPPQGMPARVPGRWVADDGTVRVDGIDYGCDTRPCNAAAEVGFAHKTGLTENYGADVGIVTALPGHDGRRYVVSVFSNLGYRYSDADRPDEAGDDAESGPTETGVCYSRKFAELGRAVDDLMRRPWVWAD
jgi:hypothetical protein